MAAHRGVKSFLNAKQVPDRTNLTQRLLTPAYSRFQDKGRRLSSRSYLSQLLHSPTILILAFGTCSKLRENLPTTDRLGSRWIDLSLSPQIDVTIILFVLAAFIAYFFLSGFAWGAGFQPTPKKEIDLVAQLLGLQEDMVLYDLGSGSGSVLIYLAKKYKVKCVGIEIDPLKVWLSKLRITFSKDVSKLVEIKGGNFLSEDLSKADVIYAFLSGGTKIMSRLERKLQSELKENANVASYVHTFPNSTPIVEAGKIRIYSLYNLKQRA